jgi:outer membrane protein TolC
MNGHRLAIVLVCLALPAAAGAAEASAPAPISLDEALKRLDDQSFTLVQARSRAQEARALVRQSMAAFLPTASASGSYVRNNAQAALSINSIFDAIEGGLSQVAHQPIHLDRSQVPGDTVIQPLESFSGQAGVRVPVIAGNAYWDWQAAQESAKATEISVDAVRLQLRAAVVQSAWWSGAAEDIADASQRALTVAQEHERSAARAVEAGTSAPLAHLQAQTEVVRRESDVARTRADRARAWLAVGVLLGKAEPVRVSLPASSPPEAKDTSALIADGLAHRPELRANETSLRAAQKGLDSAWWRLAPQLSLSFAGFASNVAYPTGEKAGWRASVDFTWTLYDGGFRYGKREQAEAQIATARAAIEAQKVEVSQQVLDATRDQEVARDRLTLAERQKELAQAVFASAKRSFEAGIASSLDVLDANDRLYQADVGLADARARLGMATAALARATASLL